MRSMSVMFLYIIFKLPRELSFWLSNIYERQRSKKKYGCASVPRLLMLCPHKFADCHKERLNIYIYIYVCVCVFDDNSDINESKYERCPCMKYFVLLYTLLIFSSGVTRGTCIGIGHRPGVRCEQILA